MNEKTPDRNHPGKSSLKERAAEELRRYLEVSAYLFVCFAVLLFYRNELLSEEGVTTISLGFAAGKALFEIKRPGIDKGRAVRTLMTHAPFAGRRPVFVGDDVTDESVFDVLPSIGGKGFGVGRHFSGARGIFRSPADVRAALHQLSGNG